MTASLAATAGLDGPICHRVPTLPSGSFPEALGGHAAIQRSPMPLVGRFWQHQDLDRALGVLFLAVQAELQRRAHAARIEASL
jgi:hypothetical protein